VVSKEKEKVGGSVAERKPAKEGTYAAVSSAGAAAEEENFVESVKQQKVVDEEDYEGEWEQVRLRKTPRSAAAWCMHA